MINHATEAATPALTVVLVATQRFAVLRQTLRHLRAQTIARQIELIILGTTDAELSKHTPQDIEGFHSVKRVAIGTILNVDHANIKALPHATSAFVAFIEDHAFPMPEWAEAVVKAFEGPFDVVGVAMLNANPDTMLSWANMSIAHGGWLAPAFTGERGSIGLHNSSFRKSALLEYGDGLVHKAGRDGGLLQDMTAKGKRFYLPATARLAHVNPSRFAATFNLRFNAGRAYGAQRAEQEHWSLGKRLLYIGGAGLIPAVRFVRLYRDMKRIYAHYDLLPRVLPALLLTLVMDALGQMVGYVAGYGPSREVLANFEMDRVQHLIRGDRRLLQDG